ncbi:MAG TPA: helix-turn-helix domain-containing protein [Candidatus Onthomonas avicola]|nr:helix-turn-helix domain-containing protein [Candidatus Onthomonas avicola]
MVVSVEPYVFILFVVVAKLYVSVLLIVVDVDSFEKEASSLATQPIHPGNLPLVLSVSKLADVLQIGRNSAYYLVRSGQIRCIRIGRSIRIPQAALLEYLDLKTK